MSQLRHIAVFVDSTSLCWWHVGTKSAGCSPRHRLQRPWGDSYRLNRSAGTARLRLTLTPSWLRAPGTQMLSSLLATTPLQLQAQHGILEEARNVHGEVAHDKDVVRIRVQQVGQKQFAL